MPATGSPGSAPFLLGSPLPPGEQLALTQKAPCAQGYMMYLSLTQQCEHAELHVQHATLRRIETDTASMPQVWRRKQAPLLWLLPAIQWS